MAYFWYRILVAKNIKVTVREKNYLKIRGMVFGRLTVIKLLPPSKHLEMIVLCKCQCGNEREVKANNLKRGHSVSCGCYRDEKLSKTRRQPELDFVNKKFGRVLIIKDLGEVNKKRMVLGRCDCGNEKSFRLATLKNGQTSSCGCYRRIASRERKTTHGLTRHPLHRAWCNMIQRCTDTNCKYYTNYGGRGVVICDEWLNSFELFYNWCISNGWKTGLEVDKDIKGDGLLYSPGTCSIVTSKNNNRARTNNFKIIFNNEEKCLAEWCEILSLDYNKTYQRIKRDKWTINRAFAIYNE